MENTTSEIGRMKHELTTTDINHRISKTIIYNNQFGSDKN